VKKFPQQLEDPKKHRRITFIIFKKKSVRMGCECNLTSILSNGRV